MYHGQAFASQGDMILPSGGGILARIHGVNAGAHLPACQGTRENSEPGSMYFLEMHEKPSDNPFGSLSPLHSQPFHSKLIIHPNGSAQSHGFVAHISLKKPSVILKKLFFCTAKVTVELAPEDTRRQLRNQQRPLVVNVTPH